MQFLQKFFQWMGILFLGFGLVGCNLIDDYVLGKDNTLKPKPLPEIKPRVHLEKIWSTPVGKVSHNQIYYKIMPVVRGETIFTADQSGSVAAVNRKNGAVLWKNQIKQSIVSGPTVDQGLVVLGTDASTLMALSATDGHIVWEAPLSGDALSKSVLTADKVIAKSIDGHLYALDINTGKQIWSMEHESPNLILKASSSPKIMGDLVIVGYSDGKLDAVDLHSGRMVWQRSIAYANGASDVERLIDIDADPIIRNQLTYLASYQGYIGALNLQNGEFLWSKRASIYKNMAIDGDALYAVDSHDVVWAYDRATGHVKWKQEIFEGHGLTEPLLLGSRVVLGDKSGQVHVLAKSNGEVIGRENIGAAIIISPTVLQKNELLLTANGLLTAYQVRSQT